MVELSLGHGGISSNVHGLQREYMNLFWVFPSENLCNMLIKSRFSSGAPWSQGGNKGSVVKSHMVSLGFKWAKEVLWPSSYVLGRAHISELFLFPFVEPSPVVLSMWPCKNIFHIQVWLFTTLQAHPFLKRGQQIGGGLLIANHLDESLWWINQKHWKSVKSYLLHSFLQVHSVVVPFTRHQKLCRLFFIQFYSSGSHTEHRWRCSYTISLVPP